MSVTLRIERFVTTILGMDRDMARLTSDQLDFFTIPEKKQKYSNLLEFFHAILLWNYDKTKKVSTAVEEAIQQKVVHYNGEDFKVTMSVAPIIKNGEKLFILPSTREEMVFEALIKIATENQLELQRKGQDEIGVHFTIRKIHSILEEAGHSYIIRQIKEAIDVLSLTNLSVSNADGSQKHSSQLLTEVWMRDRKAYLENPDVDCIVRFHSLVTKALEFADYRLYNYYTCMNYKSPMSRWLHKRLVRNFRYAEYKGKPYSLKTSTFIENSPFKLNQSWSKTASYITRASQEMIYDPETNPTGMGVSSNLGRLEKESEKKNSNVHLPIAIGGVISD
jgi:hypothetical protein